MENIDIVNKSGFPLQIAIENLIGHEKRHVNWRVLHSEHSWKLNNESGFIDLILELDGGIFVLVVECKRVLNSSWYFLNAEGKLNNRRHSKAWVTQNGQGKPKQFNWLNIPLDPSSPECEYCTILGQDSKSKPMLERVASTLVKSTEAYAREDYYNVNETNELKVYFNVIITTAKLEVCSFDPKQISIADGTLDECDFTEVPYLRFRKQLQEEFDPKQLSKLNEHETSRAKENSVFIVNSQHINKFLKEFDIGTNYTLKNNMLTNGCTLIAETARQQVSLPVKLTPMKLIYKASNSIEAHLILNQLEQSGIPGSIEGEHLQGIELIDGGGFVKVLVAEEYYEQAIEIINEIEFTKTTPEQKTESVRGSINFKSFFIGGLVGASIVAFNYYLPFAQQKYDRNGDGEVDEKNTYINYQISKTEYDRNFDGKPDFKYWYNRDGSPKTSKSDENFDGVFETEATYRAGNVVTSISDTTNDGFGNYHVAYKHGVLERVIFISPITKKPTKIQYYEALTLRKAELDLDGDGLFDITYKYDDLEEIIK